MEARYALSVRVRFEPRVEDVTVEPETVETRLYREADEPGTDGWLFFRDNLWRGEVSDPDHARRLAEDALGVPVESAEFRALYTDEAYLAALKDEIAANLDLFKADDVTEVLSKYLGSSVQVTDAGK